MLIIFIYQVKTTHSLNNFVSKCILLILISPRTQSIIQKRFQLEFNNDIEANGILYPKRSKGFNKKNPFIKDNKFPCGYAS